MNATASIAAFLCTTTISLLPNLFLFIFPAYYEPNSPLLSIGQAVAAGALLGDVFLHTLPHALMEEHEGEGGGHDHGHHHHGENIMCSHEQVEQVGIAIMFGFFVFFIFDVLVRSFGGDHHHHHHQDNNKKREEIQTKKMNWKMSSAVILNLVADSLHNFTDGIAIGASFASSSLPDSAASSTGPLSYGLLMKDVIMLVQSRGGLASLAVLFHEIPHELGDFSILVSSGMSKTQAIRTQFSTAIAAYLGTYVGLVGMEHMKLFFGYDLMIPFTAGGFIYLSTVTILPSILEEKQSWKVRLAQVVSFVMGIVFMYYVGVLEHHEGGSGHSHDHSQHHNHLEGFHDHHSHDHHSHDHQHTSTHDHHNEL